MECKLEEVHASMQADGCKRRQLSILAKTFHYVTYFVILQDVTNVVNRLQQQLSAQLTVNSLHYEMTDVKCPFDLNRNPRQQQMDCHTLDASQQLKRTLCYVCTCTNLH